MRRDLILPALLLVALTAMGLYATTAHKEKDTDGGVDIATVPASCDPGQLISRVAALPEASGLTASRQFRNLFWSHNDSSVPFLYAIAADGALRGQVQLTGASVIDWEAIAIGPCNGGNCVFVGDIGDNDHDRKSITIYRTHEPSPTDKSTAPVQRVEGVYPEGPQDAEAIFVAQGALFLVTKGEGAPIRVYRFPAGMVDGAAPSGGRLTLQLIATLTDAGPRKKARVTDAAVSPDGRWVALRTNDQVLFYTLASLLSGTPETPLAYDLAALKEPQGEGIAWADDRTLYLAGEAEGGGTFGRVSCTLPR